MIATNKHSAKPKNWCFKMPNAPYLERSLQAPKKTNSQYKIHIKEIKLKKNNYYLCKEDNLIIRFYRQL